MAARLFSHVFLLVGRGLTHLLHSALGSIYLYINILGKYARATTLNSRDVFKRMPNAEKEKDKDQAPDGFAVWLSES